MDNEKREIPHFIIIIFAFFFYKIILFVVITKNSHCFWAWFLKPNPWY
jgi:hypothetical protein